MHAIEKKGILDYLLRVANKRNISQRKLIEGIYDYSHFNRMCNGKEEVSLEVLYACCKKLDIVFEELIRHFKLNSSESFESIRFRFEQITVAQQFESLFDLLVDIGDRRCENPKFNQLYYLISAVVESELNHNHLYALDLYEKGIQCTRPSFTIDKYNIGKMSDDEVNILYNIAYEYCKVGREDKAVLVLEKIIDRNKETLMNLMVVYKASYELSRIYIRLGKYKETIEILEYAIMLGRNTQQYIGFGYLYYSLAIANSYLDKKEESLYNLEHSINMFIMQDRPKEYIEKLRRDYKKEAKH